MMKTALAILLVLVATGAPAQSLQDCYNTVGIFTVPEPDLADPWGSSYHQDYPGIVFAYVVLINPYNEQAQRPITLLGGYEFRVEYPERLYVEAIPPAGSGSYFDFPNLSLGVELPVVDRRCLLLTLQIATFTSEPAEFFLTPITGAVPPAIPGEMAVADAEDGLSLSRAVPLSGDFLAPVYFMFPDHPPAPGPSDYWHDCAVVPSEATTWGALKAIYR